MKFFVAIMMGAFFLNCGVNNQQLPQYHSNQQVIISRQFPPDTWQYFLQHLPVKDGPILDYTGKPVSNQAKHVAIINYDVGTADLQQCADALIRLRSEYLFEEKKYDGIGFHFCGGQFYSWDMYCRGIRPRLKGNAVKWITGQPVEKTHASLRSYLNIVYDYANTISLCKELKPANDFAIGTVIICPGSPGHCCMIVDEGTAPDGSKVYKIAEGYMPAQSIYVLSNPYESKINPWYHLQKGVITTASCRFLSYYLKRFE